MTRRHRRVVSRPTRIGTGQEPVWSGGASPDGQSGADQARQSQGTRVVRPGESWAGPEGDAVDQTRDDTDEGWGEQAPGRDAEWYRSQRPPHWE
ncbi:MAG: hypothetical protein LWW86_02505 [Micrococcales bacterium]|nr:hypothetical protein [Micrococcales bacterium]